MRLRSALCGLTLAVCAVGQAAPTAAGEPTLEQQPDPAIATFRDGIAACAMEQWSDEALAAKGFQHGAHYSLRSPGQRVQTYDKVGGGDGLSLHSSLLVYIACSTGVDIGGPTAFEPTRDALVKELGLIQAPLKELKFSESAKAFLEVQEIDPANISYVNETYAFIFGFRQFNGRNRMFVNVVRREKVTQ